MLQDNAVHRKTNPLSGLISFNYPGYTWLSQTAPFWPLEGLCACPQTWSSLMTLSDSHLTTWLTYRNELFLRIFCNSRIILLIKHAVTEAGQKSPASFWQENPSGARERGPPRNPRHIRVLIRMAKQDRILFDFHILELNLCSAPSVYPVSSLVCRARGRSRWWWEGGRPLGSRVIPCMPFPCLIWT